MKIEGWLMMMFASDFGCCCSLDDDCFNTGELFLFCLKRVVWLELELTGRRKKANDNDDQNAFLTTTLTTALLRAVCQMKIDGHSLSFVWDLDLSLLFEGWV